MTDNNDDPGHVYSTLGENDGYGNIRDIPISGLLNLYVCLAHFVQPAGATAMTAIFSIYAVLDEVVMGGSGFVSVCMCVSQTKLFFMAVQNSPTCESRP